MKKHILKVSLISLLCLALIFIIAVVCIVFISPITFANMFENTGNYNLSMYFYIKVYEKDKNINDLHTVVDKAILFKDYENIVKYYPVLETQDRYSEFMTFIDQNNYSMTNSVLENLALSNENNRLKNRYVKALCETNRIEAAFAYATEVLYDNLGGNCLTFAFSGLLTFLNENTYTYLNDAVYGRGEKVCDRINTKFNDLYIEYQQKKSAKTLDNLLLAKYSSKLLEINQILLSIVNHVDSSDIPQTEDLVNTRNILLAEYRTYIA